MKGLGRINVFYRIGILIIIQCFLLTGFCSSAKAEKIKIKASVLQSGHQFTLVDMPYNGPETTLSRDYFGKEISFRVVQNFALTPDGKYIFTTSEAFTDNINTGDKHTLFACCSVPSEKGPEAVAQNIGSIILDKYGHGEAVAVTQPNPLASLYHVYVACTPNDNRYSQLGTEIMQLTCLVGGNGLTITKSVKLVNFAQTGVKYKKKKLRANYLAGNVRPSRLNVAVCVPDNRMAFRISLPAGTYYTVYDLAKLEQQLDMVENGGIYDMKDAVSFEKAVIRCGLRPSNSFQSFDIDANNLYISGGNLNKATGIYVFPYKSTSAKKIKVQDLNSTSKIGTNISIQAKLTLGTVVLGKDRLEIEGMQVLRNAGGGLDFYISFFMKGRSIRREIGIYKFSI